MITHDTISEVKRFGITGEVKMTMNMNRKGFKILINNLYSNKAGAIVREISYNAFDAHRMANKRDEPIIITIPNYMDHNFIVRDNGIGLSPEDVVKYLGTLFESSKEESNDQVGTWGLGAKSPFALTESFTVESRWNGTKYKFMFFMNEEGIPSVLPTGEEPTDEHNGITYSVPVGSNQYDTFKSEIRNQLFMMEPRPIIENEEDFTWIESTNQMTLGATCMFDLASASTYHYKHSQHSVSMGGVVYALDLNQLEPDQQQFLNSFTRSRKTVTEFPLGVLDILPSREGLSYDKPTIDSLREYFREFMLIFFDSVVDECKLFDTPYKSWFYLKEAMAGNDVWKSYNKPVEVPNYGSQIALGHEDEINVVQKNTSWNDKGLRVFNSKPGPFIHKRKTETLVPDAATGKMIPKTEELEIRYTPFSRKNLSTQGYFYESSSLDWKTDFSSFTYFSYEELTEFAGDTGTYFIINDVEKNFRRRAKKARLDIQGKCNRFVEIALNPLNDPTVTGVKDVAEIMNMLEGTEFDDNFRKRFIFASDIVLDKIERNESTRIKGLWLYHSGNKNPSEVADMADVDGDFFIRTEGLDFLFYDNLRTAKREQLSAIHPFQECYGYNVYIMQKSAARKESKLRDNCGLMSFEEYFNEFLARFTWRPEFLDAISGHIIGNSLEKYRSVMDFEWFKETESDLFKYMVKMPYYSSDESSISMAMFNRNIDRASLTKDERYLYAILITPVLSGFADKIKKSPIWDPIVALEKERDVVFDDFAKTWPLFNHQALIGYNRINNSLLTHIAKQLKTQKDTIEENTILKAEIARLKAIIHPVVKMTFVDFSNPCGELFLPETGSDICVLPTQEEVVEAA